MKINDIQTQNIQARMRSQSVTQKETAGKGGGARARGGSDQVNLSDDASQLAAAVSAASTPAKAGVDPIRVAEIKDAIRSGNFPIDVRRLAETIVKEDLGL